MSANENLAFDALSDRVRRQILSLLGERGELTVSEIAASIDAVGRSTVSSHLRVLRTTGILDERRDGRRRLYSLNADGAVRDAFRYLQSLLQAGVALDSAGPGTAHYTAESDPDADHERDAS